MTAGEQTRLIQAYESLAGLTTRMLGAARAGQWDSLASLQADCARVLQRLQRLEGDAPLPEVLRRHKADLIRKVLADDAQIRDLAEPRLARLDCLLRSNRNERGLLRAYGASPR